MTEPQRETSQDEGEKLVLTSPEQASSPKDLALWAGVILLAVLSAYSPALHGKFIWDDDKHVSENRALRNAPGLLNIWAAHWRWLFTGNKYVLTPQYYPLTHTTFWLETRATGYPPGPDQTTIFHVTNIVLHAGAAILLWFLLRELLVPGAWFIAAIFALHPIQVESVAWISERKNVLAGVFFFAALLVYVRGSGFRVHGSGDASSPNRQASTLDPHYWLALLLFVCALLSKTTTAAMPAVVLLIIWWKRGRIAARDVARLAPFFAIALALALFTSHIERNWVGASGPEWEISPAQRILVAGRAVWFYVGKTLWPAKLTFIYPRWEPNPADVVQWIAPLAVAAVLLTLFLLRRRIGRGAVVAAAIYCGVLLPALGLFRIYPQRYSYVADHFQYLALPALAAPIVVLAARALKRAPEALPYVLGGAVLVVLTVLTVVQAGIYESQLTLWRDAVRKNPDSWMTRNSYGAALMEEAAALPADATEQRTQMLNDAEAQFARAVEIRADYDRALMNWGRVLMLRSQPAEALEKLDAAIAINPENVGALIERARALAELKRTVEAKTAYEQALRVAGNRPDVQPIWIASIHRALAEMALQEDRPAEARGHYQQAVQLAPYDAELRRDYGNFLAEQNELPAAAVELATAIAARPDYIDAHIDLALLRLRVGNLGGARESLRRAGALVEQTTPTPEQATRLLDAGKKWSDAFEATTRPATTRPATTRAATAPASWHNASGFTLTQTTTAPLFLTPATQPAP